VDDVAEFTPSHKYELVLCRGVLHFIDADRWPQAIAALQGATAPDGVNAISVFDDGLPVPDDLRPLVRKVASTDELRRWYAGWSIEHAEPYVLEDEHPCGSRHRHSVLRFRARRPGKLQSEQN
jgi:Tellurite resistance protein TehB